MEEVDQIILHSLKNIGCEFVDGMESFKQLNTENIIEAAVKCLKVINPEFKMSHMFPPGMSARFRVGTSIAQECKNVGYTGSLGYQTFLYSSEVDIRKIFMFLVEKLPRKKGVEVETGSDSVLNKRIGQVLRECCAKSWLPFYSNIPKKTVLFQTQHCKIPKYDRKKGNQADSSDIPFIHEQAEIKPKLIPTLLELNVHHISKNTEAAKNSLETGKEKSTFSCWPNGIKQESKEADLNLFSSSFEDAISSNIRQYHQSLDSRFLNSKKLQFTKEEPDISLLLGKSQTASKNSVAKSENLNNDYGEKINSNLILVNNDITAEEKEENLKNSALAEENQLILEEKTLHEATEAMKNKHKNLKKQFNNAQTLIQEMKLAITDLENINTSLKEKIVIKGKTVQLLPNAKENIQKLQNLVDSNKERLIGLGQMWEERKLPMVAEIEALREMSTSEVDVDRKMAEIKILRRRMKETSEETKKKEQTIKQLKAELENMSQNNSRQSYTHRILEIVASIHKQQDEIQRVIKEIKKVQKTINQQRGRIDRTFTAADEIMFKDAKTDDGVRQAYKYMVALHDSCNDLLETVTNTGNIIREIRELEDQVDIELSKNAGQNLKKIAKDLKEMKKENSELMKQFKNQN